jgi:TonB family protein
MIFSIRSFVKGVNYAEGPSDDWPSLGTLLWTAVVSIVIHFALIVLVVPGLNPVDRRIDPRVYHVTLRPVALTHSPEIAQPPPPIQRNRIPRQERKPVEAVMKMAVSEKRVVPFSEVAPKRILEVAPKPDVQLKEEEELKQPVPLPMTAVWTPEPRVEPKKDEDATSPPRPMSSGENEIGNSPPAPGEVKISSGSGAGQGNGPGRNQGGGSGQGQLEGRVGSGGGSSGGTLALVGPGGGAGAGSGSGSGPETGRGGSGKGVSGLGPSGTGGSGPGSSANGFGQSGVGSGLPRPSYAGNPKPVYPAEAKKKGYQGDVLLRVEVLANGRVGQIEVKKSSSYELLDISALEAVRKWRFIPGRKEGLDVTVWVNIPIKFELR